MKWFYFLLFFTALWLNGISQVKPSGNIIDISITQPQATAYTYDSAFRVCKKIGMGETGLFFPWTALETAPDTYNMAYMDIANAYYPAYNTPINITIAPIATDVLELPSDLRSLELNDPKVIKRFKTLLDTVFAHIPKLSLTFMVIGSEMDIYLGSDSAKWKQWTDFYDSASAYAKTKRTGLKTACEGTFNGITGADSSYMKRINTSTDYMAVSYYPLKADFTVEPPYIVSKSFKKVTSMYPSKQICFTQLGYPSSASCKSSLTLQQDFIKDVFGAWDTAAAHIQMIAFTWLHDLSPASIAYYENYYSVADTTFGAYLGTLGLRTYAGGGTDKPAFGELICQARVRGYNTLSCTTTGIGATTENNPGFIVYPNPATGYINIQSDFEKEAIMHIYDITGKQLKAIIIKPNQTTTLDISSLPAGLYFIKAVAEGEVLIKNIVVVK